MEKYIYVPIDVKERLPKEEGVYITNIGEVHFPTGTLEHNNYKHQFDTIKFWLEKQPQPIERVDKELKLRVYNKIYDVLAERFPDEPLQHIVAKSVDSFWDLLLASFPSHTGKMREVVKYLKRVNTFFGSLMTEIKNETTPWEYDVDEEPVKLALEIDELIECLESALSTNPTDEPKDENR